MRPPSRFCADGFIRASACGKPPSVSERSEEGQGESQHGKSDRRARKQPVDSCLGASFGHGQEQARNAASDEAPCVSAIVDARHEKSRGEENQGPQTVLLEILATKNTTPAP